MKTRLPILAAAALMLASAAAMAGTATVRFAHPDKYEQLPAAQEQRTATLRALARHFDRHAATLPANAELQVEVLELHATGRMQPFVKWQPELRVVSDLDWPSMRVRYAVKVDGVVVQEGEERFAGMQVTEAHRRYHDDDSLSGEKTMIDAWFKSRIAGK